MKFKILLLAFVASFVCLSAQNTSTLKRQLKWNGVETWTTDRSTRQVVGFADAIYPDGDLVPYYHERFAADVLSPYNYKVTNAELIPLTDEEARVLVNVSLPEEIQFRTFTTSDRGNAYRTLQVLPFVNQSGKLFRVSSFDIEVEKQAVADKVAAEQKQLYAENSVLASGKFVKVKVKESGIYKLTYEALSSMGVNPVNVRVFGYGGALLHQNISTKRHDDLPEVAVWMEKGADGVFNAGDYILFYGQGVVKWNYDNQKKSFVHTLNHYSSEGYYFITSDVGEGRRIETVRITPPTGATVLDVTEFSDYQHHELEKLNLGKTGKVFYGEEFNMSPLSYNFNFNFPNIVNAPVKAFVDLAVTAGTTSSFSLKLNDGQAATIPVSSKSQETYTLGYGVSETLSFANSNSTLNFLLSFSKTASYQKAYLNYLEVNVRRKLIMTGNVMFFRNVDNYLKYNYNRYQIESAGANVQIWDITDPVNAQQIETTRNGNLLEFIDSNASVKEYVAIDPSAKAAFTLEPISVGVVANQNLHALTPADFTIITHPMFLPQAEKLAQAHRDVDGMSVNVMTTEQVYNEYSSGTPDATAYRLAMKMWYDRTAKQQPKYLLLFGRGSYDNRGIINNSGDNLVITYQADNSLDQVKSYVTDDYFGLLDNGEGVYVAEDLLDVGVGRFPVSTTKQAEDVVNKTIAYMKNDVRGNWKNQLGFVADDGDAALHMRDMDNQVVKVMQTQFPGYQYNKIYLDSYKKEITANGESYPLARTKLNSLVHSGLFMLNFMGHAGEFGWTKEGVLTTNDVRNMYNTKLPFWVTATCDFVLFDVKTVSAGEHVLLNPTGGGIGLFSAARVVYAAENARLNNKFVQYLFRKNGNNEYPRMGDVVRLSKNDVGSGMNKLSYMLFGNPALRMNYPTNYKVITEKINNKVVSGGEVLKALSVNEISGYITDENGQPITDFNGMVEVSIADKVQRITTLNNQNGGAITYDDRPNMLYSGKTNVVNGRFAFTMMVPRDIRYNYGSGRINYYASEDENGREAQGYYENFTVGGSETITTEDTTGPNVEMYLNSPGFVSGGKVNETPVFVAKLSDENGINTVGSGIGHDIKLVVDDNASTTYTLNEYYESDAGSYQSGTVRMKLPQLKDGKHTLRFYVWDLLNNSTLATLDFEVVSGLAPQVFGVSNYPNPVKTSTSFVIEHDRPETILETTLLVYDISGRLLFTEIKNSADNLSWNLIDSSGERVKPGVYLYRIAIKTPSGKETSKANKIIVLGQ